jgi:type II secretory pathway pseudopilin PulG
VVIAVGLVAFVLTAILGLLVIATNETKNADLKARLAWITERVTSEYQSQRFSAVLTNLPATSHWDYSGMPVTNTAEAYFRCDVSNVTPPPAGNLTTNNFALLQLSTRWPYPNLTSTNVSLISLFNYQ